MAAPRRRLSMLSSVTVARQWAWVQWRAAPFQKPLLLYLPPRGRVPPRGSRARSGAWLARAQELQDDSRQGMCKTKSGLPPFRIINQTQTCRGPRLVIFQRMPPAEVLARGQIPPGWLSEDGHLVSLVLSKGTLTPTRGGVFHDLEAGRELIQRARAAEPHLPLPTYPERKVQAPPPLPPPPPQPPVAAPMLWSGISAPAWRPPAPLPRRLPPNRKSKPARSLRLPEVPSWCRRSTRSTSCPLTTIARARRRSRAMGLGYGRGVHLPLSRIK